MVSDAEIPEETPPQPSPSACALHADRKGREPLPLLRREQGEVCLEFNHLPFNHYRNRQWDEAMQFFNMLWNNTRMTARQRCISTVVTVTDGNRPMMTGMV